MIAKAGETRGSRTALLYLCIAGLEDFKPFKSVLVLLHTSCTIHSIKEKEVEEFQLWMC